MPSPEELAPEREDAEAGEEEDERAPARLGRLCREERAAGAGEACQGDEKPEHEQAAVEAAEGAVESEKEQRNGRGGGPGKRGPGETASHRSDERAEAGDACGEEDGAAEERPGGGPGQILRVRRDPSGEVLELKAREDDGDDEGGKPQAGGEREQSAEEDVGADDDERNADKEQPDRR